MLQLAMIFKMFLVTAAYVLVTLVARKLWDRSKAGVGARILVGLVFGGCSVLSTHFGVDYGMMLLNVRDIGPLAAGLFFHPASGIIAGLIGGLERYIAGTVWHIGEYTTVACSVSTALAGLIPVLVHYKLQKGARPPVLLSFFLGALMEVFHMYAVFITHRDDIRTAYEVVKVCALPMIMFTGLGLAGCSLVTRWASGEKLDPEKGKAARRSLSHQFQFWLMLGTAMIFLINFLISYSLQTQTAVEAADYKLTSWSDELKKSYDASVDSSVRLAHYIQEEMLRDTGVIAKGLELSAVSMDMSRLKSFCDSSGFSSLYFLASDGTVLSGTGEAPDFSGAIELNGHVSFKDLLAGKAESTLLLNAEGTFLLALFRCGNGYLCSVADVVKRWNDFDFVDAGSVLSDYQFPEEAYYLVFVEAQGMLYTVTGSIPYEEAKPLPEKETSVILSHLDTGSFFSEDLFTSGFCQCQSLDKEGGIYSLVVYPSFYAFADRDAQTYENGFSDILIFVGLYLIITALMRRIVVTPLSSVNASLQKITAGELNETVNVRSSTEFELLSDDINTTVDALKGYISAAEKRMEQELTLARTIQDSALPRNFDFHRTDFELFATMDPAKEVGGDFYDFFFTGPDKLALVIADVSGKGIPGALFMMQAKAAIRNQAETGILPEDVFIKANHVLCDGNDAEMFVTAWIGIIDLSTGKMVCANAGHEYPVICRAGGDYEILHDKHTLPLAVMDGAPMKEYDLQFHPGDRLFVYTDGIPEAVNKQQEAYGINRMLAALNRLKSETQEQTLKSVRQDLSTFVDGADQFDDITMLGFVYRGPGA